MSQLYTAEELQDAEYMDFYNTCRDDEDKCPDCGAEMVMHKTTTEDHKLLVRFECPKCGTESEVI